MIQRRTLLSALPFLFASACARAAPPSAVASSDVAMPTGNALASLLAKPGDVVWFAFTGTVRLNVGNANVRPATLHRAMMMTQGSAAGRFFDVWQIVGAPASAAPSAPRGSGTLTSTANDAGNDALVLERSFAHPALGRPIEYSRLSPTNARVMAIDATQIWLMDGAVAATPPPLSAAAQAAFTAWRAG